jgi:DNA polymerase
MNKQKLLEKIACEIELCEECMKGGTGKPVPGEGSADAPVMFIGEAPGREEARTGRPFVGRSGKFFRGMIRETGLREENVFITSPVHYFPVAGKPSAAMIEHGRTHLARQIEIIEPRIIVLLGTTACRALLGRNVEIAKEHGSTLIRNGRTFFISFHPAYAMRFPEGREKFIQDFAGLKTLLKHT